MLNRTQAPQYQSLNTISIPAIDTRFLDNKTPLYIINVGEQPVIKLEFSYKAGAWQDPIRGVSSFTAKMLGEGTSNHTSTQISEFFDQFGAFVEYNHGLDRASLSVFCLSKHLSSILPMLKELLQDATFPEHELEKFKNISLQTLKVNLEKTAFVANQFFRATLFGTDHPYGQSMDETTLNTIQRSDIQQFYKNFWKGKQSTIFLSGKVSEIEIDLVNDYFGEKTLKKTTEKPPIEIAQAQSERIVIEKPDAMQSTIRMGKKLFGRKHPDYFNFLVLNETLGGYFGSRLMKNIREEKGLTYGISSNLSVFTREAYLVIGTDVKKENTQQTIDEIKKEIITLQTELVAESELETVKNYMVGSFVGSLNTPFDITDRYKVIINDSLSADFYQNYIQNIRKVTAQDVIETAQQYLAVDSISEVIVGGL